MGFLSLLFRKSGWNSVANDRGISGFGRARSENGRTQQVSGRPTAFEESLETDFKLHVDLHSLLFLSTLQEFYGHLKTDARIVREAGITWVIYLFALLATFVQSYLIYSSYAWGNWEAAKAAVFSSGDVQELAVERLLGSLLLYFFVMPEAVDGVRTLLVWSFIRKFDLDISNAGGSSISTIEVIRREWIIFSMRVLVVVVYVAKLVMCIMTGVLAISVCYSTPDKEGVQGILLDFTGLLIIMEIDDIMVPFALEVAEMAGGMTAGSLEGVTRDFLNKYTLHFRNRQQVRTYSKALRWTIGLFIVVTFLAVVVVLGFLDMHMGKCHVEDIMGTWTGLFMTMNSKLCPESHPNGTRCLNSDLYSKCSPESSFCQQLKDGSIDKSSVHLDMVQCVLDN